MGDFFHENVDDARYFEYAKGQMDIYDKEFRHLVFHRDVTVIIDGKNITEKFLRSIQGLYTACQNYQNILRRENQVIRTEERRREDAWDKLKKACEEDESLKEMWDELCVMAKLMREFE